MQWEGAQRRGRAAGLGAGRAVEAFVQVCTDGPEGLGNCEDPGVSTEPTGRTGAPQVRPESRRTPGTRAGG